MGEIRLTIPDKLHRVIKYQAAIERMRLPEFIIKILKDYARDHAKTRFVQIRKDCAAGKE